MYVKVSLEINLLETTFRILLRWEATAPVDQVVFDFRYTCLKIAFKFRFIFDLIMVRFHSRLRKFSLLFHLFEKINKTHFLEQCR